MPTTATAADLSPDNPKNALKLPNLELVRMGQDSEFFLWDTAKQQVVPSYKYYEQREESKEWYPYKKQLKKRYRPAKALGAWTAKRPALSGSLGAVRLFRDGLAVEVNSAPVTCRAFLWNDVRAALLKGEPSRMSKNLAFTSRPWVEITPKQIEKFPQDLRILGCSPSLDAYKQRQKVVTVDPEKTFFRTSGSHLHMSFYGHSTPAGQKGVPEESWSPFIKLADAIVGLPATAIFGDELEAKRRKLYGQAGEFRYQPSYGGLEYRVLSSRIWNHQGVFSLLTGLWKYGLGGAGNYQRLYLNYDRAWEDDIQQAINEADSAKCFKMLELVDGMIAKAGHTMDYTPLARCKPYSLSSVCKRLRELNLKGLFPDAGVWTRPFAPDGHTGFGDYWYSTWVPTSPYPLTDSYGI